MTDGTDLWLNLFVAHFVALVNVICDNTVLRNQLDAPSAVHYVGMWGVLCM